MTSVRVAVRCRPFSPKEKNENCNRIIEMNGASTIITDPSWFERKDQMDDITAEDTKHIWTKSFTFDHSFWSFSKSDGEFASQEDVFGGAFSKRALSEDDLGMLF